MTKKRLHHDWLYWSGDSSLCFETNLRKFVPSIPMKLKTSISVIFPDNFLTGCFMEYFVNVFHVRCDSGSI